METISNIHPNFHRIRPQNACANCHVSMFIIERFVLYPITLLMLFGQCFCIIRPPNTKINGIHMLLKNINHQNHTVHPLRSPVFAD